MKHSRSPKKPWSIPRSVRRSSEKEAPMRRGEIWTANLNPARGREIGKIRPVLIVQADELLDARVPMVVVLPLTTQVYPEFKLWRISAPARDRLTGVSRCL
jgi:mRNA-degrading endonuclease toxin of MazEF toxin-antitoxin module